MANGEFPFIGSAILSSGESADADRKPLPEQYPVSPWSEVEETLQAAARAAEAVRGWSGSRFADFLDTYANLIDQRSAELIDMAHQETGLPVQPRLKDAELPRTTNQLRQAAKAARPRWLV